MPGLWCTAHQMAGPGQGQRMPGKQPPGQEQRHHGNNAFAGATVCLCLIAAVNHNSMRCAARTANYCLAGTVFCVYVCVCGGGRRGGGGVINSACSVLKKTPARHSLTHHRRPTYLRERLNSSHLSSWDSRGTGACRRGRAILPLSSLGNSGLTML
jgi:hypothetical protein